MLSRRWLPKGTPADATQRNATGQDRTGQDATRRDKAGQDRTERRRTPTGGTPARPDNLKEVEPCLAAGGSRREHLRTRRDTTRRDTTRRDTTRHDGKMHTLSTSIPHGWVRTPSLPIIIHFSLQKTLLTPYKSPSGKKKQQMTEEVK